uniref:SH2 domain-containing protein n=1 Tax=Stegastes partitus TaxID=144197 RepID=A0A3B4ZGZ9_9TELE
MNTFEDDCFCSFVPLCQNESTWVWIDGILDLIKKYLVDLWRDGYIMGFVSRERTEFLLKTKRTGTFLLRFSETNKDGAISFSWVDHSHGEPRVHAVLPYTKKELLSMSLPDVIYHYSLTRQQETRNPLRYLYPDINKDDAFGRYYKVLGIVSCVIFSPENHSYSIHFNFCKVTRWLAPLPRSRKVAGSCPGGDTGIVLRGVCMFSPCSVGSLRVLQLPPTQSKNMLRLIGDSKLSVGVNVSVLGCLSLSVAL